jgi:single-strand DNA-binding protein
MQSTMTMAGNVVKEVVVRDTPTGPVANFRLACRNGYRDRRSGQWVERTSYISVSAWRRLGENVAASVQLGQPLVVVGKPRQREWESDGQRHTVLEMEADFVGHDLNAGTAAFRRTPKGPQTADLVRDDRTGRGPAALEAAPADRTVDATAWAVPGLIRVPETVPPGDGRAHDEVTGESAA